METAAIQSHESTEKEFKSYYVVWKLAIVKYICVRPTKFKSYYVVWKQFSKST